MIRVRSYVLGVILLSRSCLTAEALPPSVCSNEVFKTIYPHASKSLGQAVLPPVLGTCTPGSVRGFPVPDPKCSPGAINPTITVTILRTAGFTTKCLRNQQTSSTEKAQVYAWYGLVKPEHNYGVTQTCELDHIIPLELGGADTLDNIWPQCGPQFFRQKDAVEHFLAAQVRSGKMSLEEAQLGIAKDWTQFIDALEKVRSEQ
jgi:hypothetical protein